MNKRTIGLTLLACGVALAIGPAPGAAQFSLDELAIRAFDITVELIPVPLKYEYVTYGNIQFTSHGTLRGTTVAQLEVTAASPVATARLELDRDVKLTSVAAPGFQVASSRLRDTLTLTFTPALPPGGRVPLTFTYEGGPDYIYNEFVLVEEGSLYPLLISPFGDYSANFARVVLKITTPGGYSIAGTGKLISRDGNTSTWDSEVPVPWVAVAGGQKHTVRDRTVAGVQMQFYVPPGEDRNLDKLADFAGRSVDYYGKLLYPFPYSQLRTVSLFIVGGGIGYPAFLLIDDRAFRNTFSGDLNRDSYLFHLIAHEILHSYVPSQTVPKGSGFIWLSEGFAEYLSLMALETLMGPEAFKRELQEERNLYASVVATTTEPPLGAITFTNYHGGARRSIYAKGSLVLHMLRGVVGDEVFRKGLATYFAAYRGKAARVSDFQEVMEQVSGQSLDWFFREWIQERVLPNYTIVRAKSTPLADGTFQTIAVVRNLGRGEEMPVEVGFTTTDGEVVIQKVTVFSEGDSTVGVTTSKPVKQVEVDPHQWIIQRDYTHKVFQVQ